MNNCTFVGRLTADPIIKDVGTTKLATFSLAIEEHRKDKNGNKVKRVDFFDFSAWDSGALKGDMIAVNAVARQEKWNDSNGQPKQKVAFRVQNFRVFKDREPNDTQ
jgi:single stranded DNA-binding protein